MYDLLDSVETSRTTKVLRAELAGAAAAMGTVGGALGAHAVRVRHGHNRKGGEEQSNTQLPTERHV